MKKIYTLITFLFIVIIQCNYAATLTEDFEAVAFTKNAYDVAPAGNGTEDNVTFASGSWRIFDALRGNTVGSDRFNGTQSVRARSNTSIVSMNFDKSGGAGIVSVYAAKYGGDANSTFQFELSTDGGTTWPNVSPTFSLTSTTLTQFTWNANISGNVRIRIVKLTTTSTSNRCNYDDFSITDYTGSVPEINLQQPAGSDSACGMTYNFGTQTIGTNTDVTVRIQNTGTFQLTISGTPITGTNASEFSVFTAPTSPVAASSYTDMTIRFSPGVPGIKSAVLTINSDDADESACIINLTGNANYAPCTELIISEYGEPVVGSGKYIELYNGTSGAINLANYALWRVSNGAVLWSGATVMSPALSGTLAAGSTYVIANNATDVPGANLYNSTFCNWNGDDAIGLAKNISGTWYLIDAVGTDMTGYAGTGGWSVAGISGATTDHTLVRKTSVTAPNADWNTSAGSTATNSEWFVRPYQLSNVGCNVNSCSVSSTVGFVTTSTAVTEANTTVTVNVTMNSAPTSTVNVKITDALLGTATSGTDYTAFSPVTLVFTPAETYPNTKTFTVSILDDAISETNELITLDLDAQCGALVSNSRHTITIIDNEIPEGVVINEISQGSANKEYVELVITGTPGTTMDLRGWIIDDNSGIFSGGYGTQLGIAPGHIKFSDICTWEKVPVGSIILLYNASDKNVSITIPDDPTDGNLDYTYVVPIYASATTCAAMATSNLYFSSDCDKPNNVSYDQYTPPVYTNVDWNAMQLRNGGDAVQVRSSSGGFFQGISYGSKGSGSDCGTCALNQTNHPDYSVYGTDALYFSGTSNTTYANLNAIDNDFRKLSNWTKTTTASPNALETPGTWNSANNQTWILSLRQPFNAVMDDQSYTCDLRAFESRYYLDGNDSIIYWIKNNGATDHGPYTAQTIIHNTATTGKGFQNSNLTGTPLFLQKTFAGTPVTYTPANYKVKFFFSTQELQDYCDYINPILNALPGYYTGHNYTPSTVKPHLKIYRTSLTDRAWTVTSDAQVQIVSPVLGTYGAYTTFEYDGFTGFSGYALGDVVTPIIGLPVELKQFEATCSGDNRVISWTTASERNTRNFEIQYSYNGSNFYQLVVVQAIGNSVTEQHYSYTDNSASDKVYYRLKVIDNDNSFSYSQVVVADCADTYTEPQLYYDALHANYIIQSSGKAIVTSYTLYDIAGKIVRHTTIDHTFTTPVDMENLPAAVYILKMNTENNAYYKKVVKH